MAIQKATIVKFQKVVKKVYGRDITFDQASEIVHTLTGYFNTLAKIKHKMNIAEAEKRNTQES